MDGADGDGVPEGTGGVVDVGDGVPHVAFDEEDLRLGESMLRNSARVRRMGQYIGLFEWALFAYWWCVDVMVHLATHVLNPIQHLLPGLLNVHRNRLQTTVNKEVMHVAWCKVGENGKLELSRDNSHEVNHFVLLVKLAEVSDDVPSHDFPDGGDLTVWAENNGFMVIETICQGDCGMDCMAAYLGMPRRAASWMLLRNKLELCAQRVCGVHAWLAAFRMAGETDIAPENVNVSKRSCKKMLRSKWGIGNTFDKWIRRRRMFNAKSKPTTSTSDGVLASASKPAAGGEIPVASDGVLAASDGVLASGSTPAAGGEIPVASDGVLVSGSTASAGGEVPVDDEELDEALKWAVGGATKTDSTPWQVTIWKQEITKDERHAMIEAYRIRNDKDRAYTCKKAVLRKRRQYHSSRVSYRMALGKHFEEYLASEEGRNKCHKGNRWAVLCEHFGVDRTDMLEFRRRCRWVQRVHEEWKKHCDWDACKSTRNGYRSIPRWDRVSDIDRQRRRGLQGRPEKMSDVSYLLYQWFVDIRSKIAGRIRSRFVMSQARSILGAMCLGNVAGDVVPDPPKLDRKWLQKWRLRWGVSLKKPSKKYKVKRSVLKARLLIYWSNLFAVRWFFWKRFGVDLMQEQYDQKGVHMNESGSKQVPTMEMPGRDNIPVKENFHQTRERVSWMTACFSNLRGAGRKIPLEMMFKATGKRILQRLTVPDDKRYTLTTSPSGSYRTEHVVDFLKKHLLEWTEDRQKAMDWRILTLDAYTAHTSQEIGNVAWSRGYLYHEGLMVPGGATGVVQGPDTDLHAWLEAEIMEMQIAAQNEKLLLRPNKSPSDSRQDMVDHSTSLWENCDHGQGEKSFKRNGLNNALDGTEDYLITRTAKEFWVESNMAHVREQIKLEVEAYLEDKPKAEVKDVFDLLQGYEGVRGGIGHMEEGQEIEPALAHGEKPYLDEDEETVSEDESGDSDDDGDDDGHDDKGGPQKGIGHEMQESCLQMAIRQEKPDEREEIAKEADLKKDDPLAWDLRHLRVMIGLSNDMADKSIKYMLMRRRETLLRAVRHGDSADRNIGNSFLQQQEEHMREERSIARLADKAKHALKTHGQEMKRAEKGIREMRRKRKLQIAVGVSAKGEVHCLEDKKIEDGDGVPAATTTAPQLAPSGDGVSEEKAAKVAPSGEGVPEEKAANVVPSGVGVSEEKAAEVAPSGDGVSEEKSKGDDPKAKEHKSKKDKKHKHEKKHKKDKHKKKKHQSDSEEEDISKAKFFSVTLKTQKEIERALLRLAGDWKHEHKKELCLWLALQIRKESTSVRNGKIFRKATRYFQHCDWKQVEDCGVLELWLMNKIRNLSQKQRWEWFRRSHERMLAAEPG